jgi:hypothetical protein
MSNEKEQEVSVIAAIKEVIAEPEIRQSLTPASKTVLEGIVEEHAHGPADKWRVDLIEKIEKVVADLQQNAHPEKLSAASQEKLGWFCDMIAEDARRLSKGRPFDEVMEHINDRDLHLPKKYIEKMNNDLYENKITVDQAKVLVDKVAELRAEKGFEWWEIKDRKPNQPLERFQDNRGVTHAYIMERTNKSTQEKFNAACLITEQGKHLQLGTHKNISVLENRVNAYFTGIAINKIANEVSKEKGKNIVKQGMDI